MAKRKKKSVADEAVVEQHVVTSGHAEDWVEQGSESNEQSDSHPELDILIETAKGVASDVKELLREELVKNPYKTLGLALSIGYMLGGGSSKVRRSFLVSMVGRMVAKSVFRRLLEALADREHGVDEDDSMDMA